MKIKKFESAKLIIFCKLWFIVSFYQAAANENFLKLNEMDYFEKQGLNFLVFSNCYEGLFNDAKMSGIEIIHHGVRTATNGDVRLSTTPGQWEPVPELIDRKVDRDNNSIEVILEYSEYNFIYHIVATAKDDGLLIKVLIDKPLPEKLVGLVGLNIEFLPPAYFQKCYYMDGRSGIFPLYPVGIVEKDGLGIPAPKPLAEGTQFILSPEDPERHITISSSTGTIKLYDGRNTAQNGWFVARTLIPASQTGKVVEWFVTASTIDNWIRKPVIAHSQIGYHPEQVKTAVIELDKNDHALNRAELYKVSANGKPVLCYSSPLFKWGRYLRYEYYTFDFSRINEEGIYYIAYGNVKTSPFVVSRDIYKNAWQPAIDIFLPVQMDHMFVNEAYRVWHGASHLDDALQAPVNHQHFDLYAQGAETDTPYKPGEHIPGLNIGGWFDAGDFDLRTQTHYNLVSMLVRAWEDFKIMHDATTIDQHNRYVDMHIPDGKPDIIQQIEHGTLALIAQFRSVGHAIPGIIASDLSQYTHLGDASTITDNLIYSPALKSNETDGFRSGKKDDRWAFTSRSTALNYGSIAALTAASRSLKGYNDTLAIECLETAIKVWQEEHSQEPHLFRWGNTTGGPVEQEELTAAVELLITTRSDVYKKRINELLPYIEKNFIMNAPSALRAIPYMEKKYRASIAILVQKYKHEFDSLISANPFGVTITTGSWAGNGRVMYQAITNYMIHKYFPEIMNKDYVFRGLNYLFGCHPESDISFVSGVGTVSKKVAYGNNRADYSFIAGGVVPGLVILKPDFPENKEDWPFLWGENEYVVNMAGAYIYLIHAANELLDN
jgi:hypothetical protein